MQDAATVPTDQYDDAVTAKADGNELNAIAAPPASPADYPRMLYHPDGRTIIVDA